MAGYLDTRQMIIDTLMGRPEGTQIQPEDHQAYALNLLNYVRSVELSSGSTLTGIAEADTVPIEPYDSKVAYITSVPQNTVRTFTYFKKENNEPITITTTDSAVFVILLWNTQYWEYQPLPVTVFENDSFVGYFECTSLSTDVNKTISSEINQLTTDMRILVKMNNINTQDNATLQIGLTQSKPLFYNGLRVSSTNSWTQNEVLDIYYDGNNYISTTHGEAKFSTGEKVGDVEIVNIPGTNLKSVMGQKGATDLVSEYNVSANNSNAEYTFSQAVALVPASLQKGGLTIKYIDNTTHEYVIKRLMSSTWNTTESNWQGIDDEPIAGSKNLVKSGGAYNAITALRNDLLEGDVIPAMAETLAPWADQKAIATPDTYTDAVRTTGGDIPIETSAGSKLESIKPVAGSKWTAKMLFNGSYNMLNAAKWGAANSQPYVGGVGSDFVYFLVPELILGTFGTADENNGLLFTDSEGENIQPTSVYFKPLGSTVPQSLTDGTSITPTSVSYDGKTYKDYATDGAGWLIVPKTIYDNDVCAHIAWEDWYDKYVSLDEPTTNPEAVVGVLMLEGLLALAHSDKYLRGVNEEVCDNVVFGDTSATITHMVDELSVAANAWTNAATGESDSHGNALYRHSATVSGIKQGGAACVEGEDGGIPLTVNGTTVSYIDTNATAPASVVFYEVTATSTTKAYTDSIFSGSNINTETGVLPINDCSIEAQVAMDGKANITVKYAKNIVDQVAINATVDVPQIKREVENHEERIGELEDTAVRTGSYDASVSVGLADNLRGDSIVSAEFYKRKTGGTQSVGSGIAAIKEVRGKSIVWNQLGYLNNVTGTLGGVTYTLTNGHLVCDGVTSSGTGGYGLLSGIKYIKDHKYLIKFEGTSSGFKKMLFAGQFSTWSIIGRTSIVTCTESSSLSYLFVLYYDANKEVKLDYHIYIIDLTLMFGAGNEPATVAEFEKMFPLDYYDYNAGEVIPFAGQNLVTTGKNQYNPATGKANLLGGQTYQIGGTYTSADIDGVAVTLDSNDCFTTTKDCVLDITGGNDTDTMVAIYDGENSAYEPYEKHTLPLDPSQWRDKQGNLVFPYGGMHGVGTAYDYAKVDADGYIRNAVRAFGSINVGDYNYTKQGNLYTTNDFIPPKANMLFSRGKGVVWNQLAKTSTSRIAVYRMPFDIDNSKGSSMTFSQVYNSNDGVILEGSFIKGHKYYVKNDIEFTSQDTFSSFYDSDLQELGLSFYTGSRIGTSRMTATGSGLRVAGLSAGKHISGYITFEVHDLTLMFGAGNEPSTPEEFEAMFPLDYYVYDAGSLGILANQTYADAASFKAAMQGVPLIYELAESVEVELATPVYAKYLVDKDGTEEITPANGTTPYTTMANLSILYAMDARGEIKNLPKNYLSKESAESMLNAMVTAGIIASYTMTWDATNSRYAFVITAPVEPEENNN